MYCFNQSIISSLNPPNSILILKYQEKTFDKVLLSKDNMDYYFKAFFPLPVEQSILFLHNHIPSFIYPIVFFNIAFFGAIYCACCLKATLFCQLHFLFMIFLFLLFNPSTWPVFLDFFLSPLPTAILLSFTPFFFFFFIFLFLSFYFSVRWKKERNHLSVY